MRVSLLPSLIATFVVLHGGVKLRQKRSEASGHLLSSLPNYLSSWRGMKTDRAGLAAKWRWSRSGQRGMQTSGEGGWEGVFGGEVQAERDRMTGSERAREWIEVKGREREVGGCTATEQERAPVKVRLNGGVDGCDWKVKRICHNRFLKCLYAAWLWLATLFSTMDSGASILLLITSQLYTFYMWTHVTLWLVRCFCICISVYFFQV